ncbi:MAG: 6,7-dimethyl-8-ribityllumazine synthase [Acidimicrobiales bacterium]
MTSNDKTAFDAHVAEGLRGRVGTWLDVGAAGAGRRVAIVAARFNGGITLRLLAGTLSALDGAGVAREDVTVAWAPGAFELPFVAKALIRAGGIDAVIALGAVIRGETGHYDFVAGQCAQGLQAVQLETGVPVVFGVLTTDTVAQALVRSQDDDANKGREAALTALEMAALARHTRRS